MQIVVADSTPLHSPQPRSRNRSCIAYLTLLRGADRYLYSGASGGKYAKDNKGVSDTLINAPASAIVINPGVTPANGFTNGNCALYLTELAFCARNTHGLTRHA